MFDGFDPSSALAGAAIAAAVIALTDGEGQRRRASVGLAAVAVAGAAVLADGLGPVTLALMALGASLAATGAWLRRRRPVRLDADQHRLHRLAFAEMTKVECQRLLQAGTWKDADAGAVLLRAGKAPNRVLMLVRGTASLRDERGVRGTVAAGRMVGEIGWVTGQPTSVEAVSEEPVRYVEWTRKDLDALFSRRPELRAQFHVAVARGVASKASLF